MKDNIDFSSVLTEYICPSSFPIAVRFLKDEPVSAKIKTAKDLCGHKIGICQGMAMVRRYGWSMSFGHEDHACPYGLVAFGHLETPEFVNRGDAAVGLYAKTREGAVKCEEVAVKMPLNSVDNVIMAPLHKAEFIPHVILIYGMPGQIVRLVQGANYVPGGALESKFGGRFACSAELVVPHVQQKYNIILPGGGEKIFAMTENHEMVFAMPGSKMSELQEGLQATHKSGIQRFPFPVAGVKMSPQFPPAYAEFEEYCGLKA